MSLNPAHPLILQIQIQAKKYSQTTLYMPSCEIIGKFDEGAIGLTLGEEVGNTDYLLHQGGGLDRVVTIYERGCVGDTV